MSTNKDVRSEAVELSAVARAVSDFDFLSIYFYYAKHSSLTGQLDWRMYYYLDRGLSPGTLEAAIATLAANALVEGSNPSCHGTSFDDLIRRRVGYVAIAIESDNPTLGSKNDILIFNEDGKTPSDTFRNPEFGSIELSKKVINWIVFENYMTKFGTNDPLGEGDYERFKIRLPMTSAKLLLDDDSGGTNMGPPVGPPYYLTPARISHSRQSA